MKKLYELTIDELKTVFEKNSKLQEKVFEDMFNNADFWNSEYLDCWQRGTVDYSIGYDRGTYFRHKDRSGFLEGLEKAQRNFGFLADEYNKEIEYCRELLDRAYYNDLSEKNLERLDIRIEELLEDLENACYKRFISEYEYCFEKQAQQDYFLEFYLDERMDNNFYINEEFELFEHIEFERSFA